MFKQLTKKINTEDYITFSWAALGKTFWETTDWNRQKHTEATPKKNRGKLSLIRKNLNRTRYRFRITCSKKSTTRAVGKNENPEREEYINFDKRPRACSETKTK